MAESITDADKTVDSKQQEWMTEFIKQEMEKIIKGKQFKSDTAVNFVHNEEFAGMISNKENSYWIVDTGASSHVCINDSLFDKLPCLILFLCIYLMEVNKELLK